MDMSYTWVRKKKDETTQTQEGTSWVNSSNIPNAMGWFTFHHWRSKMGTLDVWNGVNHVP
jgi:hypothetical protein